MTDTVVFKNVSIIFGDNPQKALAMVDAGKTRDEIGAETGLVLGVADATLSINEGEILVLMGLFGDKEYDKTGDVNANLWAGLAMLVFAAAFLVWARLRPTVVPDHVEKPDDTGPPPGH